MTSDEEEKIPLPLGFFSHGINCGVKRYNPDLGIVVSEKPCVAEALFTQNKLKGIHILYDQSLVPSKKIHGIIVNSSQANTGTGDQGFKNNLCMVQEVEKTFNLPNNSVLSASTGIIGDQISMDKIIPGIQKLTLHRHSSVNEFAKSITTTDKQLKMCSRSINLTHGSVHLTGVCKGAGMIHPNMATMLAFLFTDLKLDNKTARSLLQEATDVSFNMISIDGVTSPNDSVFFLGNGMSGVHLENKEDQKLFKNALQETCVELAKKIVADGEGANKNIEIKVTKAASVALAKRIARGVSIDNLVKTALNGSSPNWGRILSAVGNYLDSEEDIKKISIFLQNIAVFGKNGALPVKNQIELAQKLQDTNILIDIVLNNGSHSASSWTTDLSVDYVRYNSEQKT